MVSRSAAAVTQRANRQPEHHRHSAASPVGGRFQRNRPSWAEMTGPTGEWHGGGHRCCAASISCACPAVRRWTEHAQLTPRGPWPARGRPDAITRSILVIAPGGRRRGAARTYVPALHDRRSGAPPATSIWPTMHRSDDQGTPGIGDRTVPFPGAGLPRARPDHPDRGAGGIPHDPARPGAARQAGSGHAARGSGRRAGRELVGSGTGYRAATPAPARDAPCEAGHPSAARRLSAASRVAAHYGRFVRGVRNRRSGRRRGRVRGARSLAATGKRLLATVSRSRCRLASRASPSAHHRPSRHREHRVPRCRGPVPPDRTAGSPQPT